MVKNKMNKFGFTLVELLIVMAISLILVTAAVPIYGGLQVSAQLNETNSQIIQTLRTARERSVAGVNNSRHGVYFGSNTYTIYQGNSYTGRDTAYDRTATLDSALSFTYDITDGEVNFTQNKGKVNNTGTITVNHSVAGSRSIVVNKYGVVEEE
jgi:prepilin-type N-terminal cleavage/methylation domain-containing protein